ncbi:hypothetical protein D3C72_2368750 [compost metagenome]
MVPVRAGQAMARPAASERPSAIAIGGRLKYIRNGRQFFQTCRTKGRMSTMLSHSCISRNAAVPKWKNRAMPETSETRKRPVIEGVA